MDIGIWIGFVGLLITYVGIMTFRTRHQEKVKLDIEAWKEYKEVLAPAHNLSNK